MLIDMTGLMNALSFALDEVESEAVNAKKGHGKRVAYYATFVGSYLNLSQEDLWDLSKLCILHDNALTQYFYEEKIEGANSLGLHCIYGEKNLVNFPFYSSHPGAILDHHENEDGTGVFHKKTNEVGLFAKLIHFGDIFDLFCTSSKEVTYEMVMEYLKKSRNTLFLDTIVDTFKDSFTKEMFEQIHNYPLDDYLSTILKNDLVDFSFSQVKEVVNLFAKIIDYKSEFTRNHSLGIAQKAYEMANYYGYPENECERLYIAGAFHDIGKMAIHNNILEKPDRLTNDEFTTMKNHAVYTHQILSNIQGFEDICEWASYHHEKLNGKGYPYGKTAKDLSTLDRLLSVLDIYQALSEDRPYKKGMPIEKITTIMQEMVDRFEIDEKITHDVLNYSFQK